MKQEIIRIIIISLVSTIVAIGQAYLVHITGTSIPAADPSIAGIFGGIFAKTFRA